VAADKCRIIRTWCISTLTEFRLEVKFLDSALKFVKSNHIIAGHSGRAVWGVGFERLVAEIVGSNPAQGMDVC
jgi:hypothetical protein